MEVLFYHLEQARLEHVLPNLLERSLERGWRAVVRSGNLEKLDNVDQMLWTYDRESFLAHGTKEIGQEHIQPVFLTTVDENPNGAQILFLIDGAIVSDDLDYERVVYLFDGRDNDMLKRARVDWKAVSAKDYDVTYWQQSDAGKWVKKA